MSHLIAPPNSRVVALLAEGVDRNSDTYVAFFDGR